MAKGYWLKGISIGGIKIRSYNEYSQVEEEISESKFIGMNGKLMASATIIKDPGGFEVQLTEEVWRILASKLSLQNGYKTNSFNSNVGEIVNYGDSDSNSNNFTDLHPDCAIKVQQIKTGEDNNLLARKLTITFGSSADTDGSI